MGLDMYLSRKLFVKNYSFMKDAERYTVTVVRDGVKLDLGDVSYVTAQAGYWRKANAIHKWFVDNVQRGEDDCMSYHVSAEQLTELRDTCVKVLNDRSLANELLPPAEGFFFGCTGIDEFYFEDLRYTVGMINAELARPDFDQYEYSYQSSW